MISILGVKTDARYIVDGHREKTLHLLWQIIFHFQVCKFDVEFCLIYERVLDLLQHEDMEITLLVNGRPIITDRMSGLLCNE